MSMYFDYKIKCGCCGTELIERRLVSSICLGGNDLDSRLAHRYRNTMNFWVHVCPYCGYVSNQLEKSIHGFEDIVKSKEYLDCDGIITNKELVKNFIRRAIICSKLGDLKSEAFAYLHASWVCDDANEIETARILRIKSENILYKLIYLDKQDNLDELLLIDIDLLRRTDQYEEVIHRSSDFVEKIEDQRIKKALLFEVKKAKEKNNKRYKFAPGGGFVQI